MNITFIIPIAFALALDAFSVAVAAAGFLGRLNKRQKFRLSFHFGLFQFMMPIIGWTGGVTIVSYVEKWDHWVALLLLSAIGIKMILDARHAELTRFSKDVTRGLTLVGLSIATSIDALAIGFSIGLIKGAILIPSVIIGMVAAGMTLTGIYLGSYLSMKFGQRISVLGGVTLIIIGLQIVADHLHII